MCKDCKCNSEKKCCSFWKKIFGCKCEKDKSCCGKIEEKVQNTEVKEEGKQI